MRPVVSVQIDIARFCWEIMRRDDTELVRWCRDLVDCLATRDPSKHDYGAELLSDVAEFREKEKARKDAAGFRSKKENESGFHRKDTETNGKRRIPLESAYSTDSTDSTDSTGNTGDAGEHASKRFAPPTLQEAQAYAQQIGMSSFEASKAFDSYTAKGWKVGRSPMKNWQAAWRNWARSVGQYLPGPGSDGTPRLPPRDAVQANGTPRVQAVAELPERFCTMAGFSQAWQDWIELCRTTKTPVTQAKIDEWVAGLLKASDPVAELRRAIADTRSRHAMPWPGTQQSPAPDPDLVRHAQELDLHATEPKA